MDEVHRKRVQAGPGIIRVGFSVNEGGEIRDSLTSLEFLSHPTYGTMNTIDSDIETKSVPFYGSPPPVFFASKYVLPDNDFSSLDSLVDEVNVNNVDSSVHEVSNNDISFLDSSVDEVNVNNDQLMR